MSRKLTKGPWRALLASAAIATPVSDPAITAVNANGWSVTRPYSVLNPLTSIYALRQGYDTSGNPTSYVDTFKVTQQLRLAYTAGDTDVTHYRNNNIVANNLHDTANGALSDYIYASDTVLGTSAVNNSTVASPKPIATWVRADRKLVGTSLILEVGATHRNARNGEGVACVIFSVTDGSITLTVTASASEVSGASTDLNAVTVYKATIDVSTLADGQITANAKVYPWIGKNTDASAILDSSANSPNTRTFCPQVFKKAASWTPLYAYVSTTGNDTTGVANANAATAAASPCLTAAGAFAKIRAAAAGNRTDGHIVRLTAGSQAPGSPAAVTHSSISECTIEGDPADPDPRTNCVLTLSGNWTTQHIYLRLKNMGVSRGANQINMPTSGVLTLENVAYANGGTTSIMKSVSGAAGMLRVEGMAMTGGTAQALQATATFEAHLLRGVTFSGGTVDPRCVVGSILTNCTLSQAVAADSGTFIGFNKLFGYSGSSHLFSTRSDSSAPDVDGIAIVQNVFEIITAGTGTTSVKFAADGTAGAYTNSISHFCHFNNTYAGVALAGRSNTLYNEGPAARTHTLVASKGNIHVQINSKHDVFKTDGTRIQSWAYMYGVGCEGELVCYADANNIQNGAGGYFSQAYAGINSVCAVNGSGIDPKFTTPACTTNSGGLATNGNATTGYSVGAGGGTYPVLSGSPAIGILATVVLKYDLAGNPRSLVATTAGAYKGPAE